MSFILPTLVMFVVPLIALVASAVVAIVYHLTGKKERAYIMWAFAAILVIVASHYMAALNLIAAETANNIFYIFSVLITLATLAFVVIRLVNVYKVWRAEHPRTLDTSQEEEKGADY
jgi:membrane protein implicated in regulation of membrane protease activity